MNILISGSRHWSQANMQLDTAIVLCKRLVLRAKDNQHSIIVGDAKGVDAIVIDYCMVYQVPFTCYGIREYARIKGITNYTQVDELYRTYTKRDEYMVSIVDMVMCVWNGASQGTKHVYDYALQQGKEAKLWNLANE